MGSSVRMKGKSVDEAVNLALEVLGKTKEEVDVRVINEAEGGVLGVFGGKEAEVEVFPRLPIDEAAKHLTQEILDKMEYITLVSIIKVEEGNVLLEIKGEDMGRIIGKEGATLDALQYLVSVILGKRQMNRVRVIIDAEGYRERRRVMVIEDADRVANDVKKTGKERSLPPMSASDRRLVHIHVQDKFPSLTSYSRGEGIGRQLVIAPKDEGTNKGE